MDNKVKQELQEMKYLFGYKAGRVISEQENKPVEEDMDVLDIEDVDMDTDMDTDMDVLDIDDMGDVEFGDTTIKPRVRPDVDTPTKPKTRPKTPYDPKPGPKKNPKAEDESGLPDWLSFDELGIEMGED
jgi:hypothetical protein